MRKMLILISSHEPKDATYILSTKRNAMFLFAFLGVKIIDFKNYFISALWPCYKDLDCIVPS